MGDTSIEWTEKTWNPVRGCAIVSPGCARCYAMRTAHRFSGAGKPYDGLTVLTGAGPIWSGRARFVPEMLDAPLRWRKPAKVFVNSMSDLFHDDVKDEEIAAVFGVMAASPRHTFQVLTKRPARMRQWFEWAGRLTLDHLRHAALRAQGHIENPNEVGRGTTWPLPNVWLGVSVEDQQRADERIPQLICTPAAVHFISAEPLLGALNLRRYVTGAFDLSPLDWVIVGGESGAGARPFDIAWARSIVKQCEAAGVACFVKQLGAIVQYEEFPGEENPSPMRIGLIDRKGGDMAEWPRDLQVRQFPEMKVQQL